MSSESRELTLIFTAMTIFLVICAVAVFVFVRQWLREKKK